MKAAAAAAIGHRVVERYIAWNPPDGRLSKRGTTATSTGFCWRNCSRGRRDTGSYYLLHSTITLMRNDVERCREDHVEREQLQPFEPVALAVHPHESNGGDRESDGRDLESVEHQ